MKYLQYFRQKEKKFQDKLTVFQKGKLAYPELRETVNSLRQIYADEVPKKYAFTKKDRHTKHLYLRVFRKYKDMLLVERAVSIAKRFPPQTVDTILGIDTRGRDYAKLVKFTFDGIRTAGGLPKTKSLFLNVHVGSWTLGTDSSTTCWNIDYKNNHMLKGKDYGVVFAVDDCKRDGRTAKAIERGITYLREQGIGIKYAGQAYFMNFLNSDAISNPLDACNMLMRPMFYLRKSNQTDEQPSLFSIPETSALTSPEFRLEMKEDTSKIRLVADLAAKTYLNLHE